MTNTRRPYFYCSVCRVDLDGWIARESHELVVHAGRNVTRHAVHPDDRAQDLTSEDAATDAPTSVQRVVHAVRYARVTLAAVVATAALALSSHAATPVELAAYSPPDHPGCVAAPTVPGGDQTYYCDRYDVDTASDVDPVADCLTDEGFHGRPDDGSETIYATDQAIADCESATDHGPNADLGIIVAVDTTDAPVDLVACWVASGARHDAIDGPNTLTASRLVIDSCNPLGWVNG